MKKNIFFNFISIVLTMALITPLQSMGSERGSNLTANIQNKINKLKAAQPKPGEINSPAIQAEQNKDLKSLMQDAQQLDAFVATLPAQQQSEWAQKQAALLEPAKPLFTEIITTNITTTWQKYGKALAQTSINAVLAGVTTAAMGLIVQGMKIQTGNLLALDTQSLLMVSLTSTAASAITTLTKSTFLSSTSAIAMTEALISPYLTSNAYAITMPSFTGPIAYWISTETITIAKNMVEKSGGLVTMLSGINVDAAVLPAPIRIGTPSNTLVEAALPNVQTIVKNQKVASVLTEIGWIVLQSAAVGGLVHMAGLGYPNASIAISVGNAVLTGIAQGTVSAALALTNTSPGAILKISSAIISQQYLPSGATPQAIATATITATIKEVSNVLLEESRKQGGLLQTLQKAKNRLGQTIQSRWGNTWASISEAWATIQSIEPIPL